MYVLRTENINKTYKGKKVLSDVNINVSEGDIYGFVGENGAGKTTLIRIITGLINFDSGSYSLFEVKNTDKDFNIQKKKIGGIVETVSLIRNMNALENLKFQCMITDIEKSDDELIALIDKVGLNYEEIKKKKVGNFSLGMRQRLGIAVIMVSDPKFIVLDEPMNGVDPQGMIDIRNTILTLNQEGVTFLISSHILSELEKICTKVGMISQGKMVCEMDLEEFRRKSRKHTVIKCVDHNDNEKVVNLLINNLGLSEVNIENNNVCIFDDVDVNVLMKLLVNNDINIENINVNNDTIEDFYIKVMGGEK